MRDPMHEATYADLEALPENLVGQLIEGMLIAMPRPSIGHATVASNLGNDLGSPFGRGRGGPGGWWFLDEPELHFGMIAFRSVESTRKKRSVSSGTSNRSSGC